MCSAHSNITCGVNPCIKDQIHKCKKMGGKRQTPHSQPGGGRGVCPSREGSLGKGLLRGAEGNVESPGSAAVWDRDGNKCMSVGAVLSGAGRRTCLGELGDFLASM